MTSGLEDRVAALASAQADRFDAIVIGSGFGGSLAAARLVEAGWSVLMLERGDWVARGEDCWRPDRIGPLTPHYSPESPFFLASGETEADRVRAFFCVGGPSVFYGGVALRFRADDFGPEPTIVTDSGAEWPFDYQELAPYYDRVEAAIGVAGQAGADPTEPPRSGPYPLAPLPYAPTTERLAAAAVRLGLRPFPLPLAIQTAAAPGRSACIACATCDAFACAMSAKNDLATTVLPRLVDQGLRLLPRVVVTRLVEQGGVIQLVEAVDRDTGARLGFRSNVVILAAGALSSPHLVLASRLERLSPAGDAVGAYLMRHINTALVGVFARPQNTERRLLKQFGIHDFYHGDGARLAKLGAIQQLTTPPVEYVRGEVAPSVRWLVTPLLSRLLSLITIAEDQPQPSNRVRLTDRPTDRYGIRPLAIEHQYSARDHWADRALRKQARRVLRAAGALAWHAHPIRTFSHALGTLRMGRDERRAPVDPSGRFRGVDNLYVADGSLLPRSGGVNPSLTIAAMGLRVAEQLAGARSAGAKETLRAAG